MNETIRTIETVRADDGPSILQLMAAISTFDSMDRDCVEGIWNAYMDKGEASDYNFLVCRGEGRLLGYACFGPTPLTKGTFDLYWIAVDPAAQGQGIGRALLGRVEAEVLARGGRLLLIETSSTPEYVPAHRLYESSGYRCEAVIHDFYAPGDNLLIFSRPLLQT